MCGIAGILANHPNETLLIDLKKMTDSIQHRGPDGEGQWVDLSNKVALGHRRLSILDLSDGAAQPMHYLDRYVITFNGEIYNFVELKNELILKGNSFETESDTEVLLHLFHEKKEKCLNDLDGMFSFAIWDKIEEKLFCARDRFGEKPFFYSIQNEILYFGSEMKVLWAAGVPKKPNKSRVFAYLAYDQIYDSTNDSTFFENIFQLEPAHYFFYTPRKEINKVAYWKIDPKKRNTHLSFEDAQQAFLQLFKKSIERRLRSDVQVGSSLSGGLDSSSIVMLMDQMKAEGQTLKTFSARFEGFKRDEGYYIEQVVAATEVQGHNVFCTENDFELCLAKAVYHQEEPFGSKSILAQWKVMELAKKENVTVLLDGQGADEYLAGYTSFYISYFAFLRKNKRKEYKQNLIAFRKFYDLAFEKGRFFVTHAYFPNLRNKLRELKNTVISAGYLKQFNASFIKEIDFKFETDFIPDLNQSLFKATFSSGLQTLLRYSDRNAMAHSREVRLPFLSHELVEFVFSMPDEYKISEIWTKALLRYSMQDILPKEICWRKEKIGFEPPKSKEINDVEYEESIQFLEKKGVLNRKYALREKAWEYVQVKNLYNVV